MSVKFSVVGIFYNTTVDLSKTGGNTVAAIMDYLYRTDPVFYRTSIVFDNNQIINMLGAVYPSPFKSRSGITYPAGSYFLSQSFTTPSPNPYSVWQYYLADQNNVQQPVPSDRSYTVSTVQDGWSIVWRLVTIMNGPGNVAKRLKALEPSLVASASGTP